MRDAPAPGTVRSRERVLPHRTARPHGAVPAARGGASSRGGPVGLRVPAWRGGPVRRGGSRGQDAPVRGAVALRPDAAGRRAARVRRDGAEVRQGSPRGGLLLAGGDVPWGGCLQAGRGLLPDRAVPPRGAGLLGVRRAPVTTPGHAVLFSSGGGSVRLRSDAPWWATAGEISRGTPRRSSGRPQDDPGQPRGRIGLARRAGPAGPDRPGRACRVVVPSGPGCPGGPGVPLGDVPGQSPSGQTPGTPVPFQESVRKGQCVRDHRAGGADGTD